MNIDQFEKRINESFHKNGGFEDIIFSMNYDVDQMLQLMQKLITKNVIFQFLWNDWGVE